METQIIDLAKQLGPVSVICAVIVIGLIRSGKYVIFRLLDEDKGLLTKASAKHFNLVDTLEANSNTITSAISSISESNKEIIKGVKELNDSHSKLIVLLSDLQRDKK